MTPLGACGQANTMLPDNSPIPPTHRREQDMRRARGKRMTMATACRYRVGPALVRLRLTRSDPDPIQQGGVARTNEDVCCVFPGVPDTPSTSNPSCVGLSVVESSWGSSCSRIAVFFSCALQVHGSFLPRALCHNVHENAALGTWASVYVYYKIDNKYGVLLYRQIK